MITTILYIIFLVFFAYAAVSVAYLLLFSIAGLFFRYRKKTDSSDQAPYHRIAVLVPAYKEDGIILSTANNLLQLNYPKELYDIYIIADSFQPATIAALRQLPLQVIEVSFDKSTKTKSLNEAFRQISKPYNVGLICDADNMLARDFLLRIDASFVNGQEALQGRRVAKNLNSSFAILDACSEGINNHIFRKGPNALGLSSSVIGSGMAFEYELLKDILASVNAVGGFDKILQLQIVQKRLSIRYLEQALIFDEKVDSSEAFEGQRKRWVSSQFIYLRRFFIPAFNELFKGNLSYFNLAVASNLILPRAILFMFLLVLTAAGFFFSVGWGIAAGVLWIGYITSMLIAIPHELVNKDLWQAVGRLPKAIFIMLGTLLHVRKANKTFIHTVHTKTEVSNTLFDEKNS